jgi:hypothetical protein
MDKDIWVSFSDTANASYERLQEEILVEKQKGKENTFNMQLQ